ncbi:MAG: glycosyltransferase family 4 protein [Candidatus Helarchaeota archaeon]
MKYNINFLCKISLKPYYTFTHLFEIGNELKNMGHSVRIYSKNDKKFNTRIKNYSIDLFKLNKYLIKAPSIISDFEYIWNLNKTINYLIKNKRNEKVIIHIRQRAIPFLWKMIPKLCNFPVIFDLRSIHTMQAEEFIEEKNFFYLLDLNLKRIYEKIDFLYSNRIIAISPLMKKLLIKNYKIPSDKIDIISSGVNSELFNPNKEFNLDIKFKNINEKDFKIILYEGNITQKRGIETLIKSIFLVKKKIKNIKLILIGNISNKYKFIINKIVNDLNLTKNVILTGFVDYKKVPAFISIADICVSPLYPIISYQISSPLKILEYLSMEKPVIASDIYAHRLLIKNYYNGQLVEPKNPIALANAITYILENYEDCKKWGKNGRKMILKKYTWKIKTKELLKTYKRVY